MSVLSTDRQGGGSGLGRGSTMLRSIVQLLIFRSIIIEPFLLFVLPPLFFFRGGGGMKKTVNCEQYDTGNAGFLSLYPFHLMDSH